MKLTVKAQAWAKDGSKSDYFAEILVDRVNPEFFEVFIKTWDAIERAFEIELQDLKVLEINNRPLEIYVSQSF